MPRFGIKALLIGLAAVAVWLSTFSGYVAADDVRRCILLTVLAASGYAAIYLQGRHRAFWAGFFFTMLAHGFSLAVAFNPSTYPHRFGYISTLDSARILTNRVIPMFADQGSPTYDDIYRAITATFAAVWVLAVSAVICLIGLWVYDQCHDRQTH